MRSNKHKKFDEEGNTWAAHQFQVPELLHLTFTFLPLRSLAICARVSRNWFSIAVEHLWRSVSVTACLRLTSCGRRLTTQLTPIRGPVKYQLQAEEFDSLTHFILRQNITLRSRTVRLSN